MLAQVIRLTSNALMDFPQRGKVQQACSIVVATSFVDRQNSYAK